MRALHDYISHCGLPEPLIDMVYLRISQINGCGYCIDLHSHDLLAAGMRLEKVLVVPVWREIDGVFDARERAALRWAESLTRLEQTGAPDNDYEEAASVFNEKELADLTLAISLMNAYNRIGVGLRVEPRYVNTPA